MVNLTEKITEAALGVVIGGSILVFTAYHFKTPIIETYQDYQEGFESQREEIKDLDGNNIPERYIEFNGKKYFLEVNGKRIEDSIKQ